MEKRCFVPVLIYKTRRGEVVLQREVTPAPRTVEHLRQLMAEGKLQGAQWGSYCVQFGGNGHYFSNQAEALEYLCKRWGEARILRGFDKAIALAEKRLPEALL